MAIKLRTDITLNQQIAKIVKLMKKDKGYKGAEGAATLAIDVGFVFHDFSKNQWEEGIKASWKIALARYGKTPPINQSNWEYHIRKSLEA